MPNTPNGLPYPASTATPDVPRDLAALATALDRLMPQDRVYVAQQSATTSVPSGGSGAVVAFHTALDESPDGMWSDSQPTRLVAVKPGRYLVQVGVGFASPGATPTGYREVQITKMGTAVARARTPAVASASTLVVLTDEVVLAAGEYVEVVAVQNQGTALDTVSGGTWTRAKMRYVGSA